jgi:hypothetical protein
MPQKLYVACRLSLLFKSDLPMICQVEGVQGLHAAGVSTTSLTPRSQAHLLTLGATPPNRLSIAISSPKTFSSTRPATSFLPILVSQRVSQDSSSLFILFYR